MSCGAWLTTFDPWPKRTLPPKTRSGNEPWSTACSPFRSEGSKSRHLLFCSRVCGWLCSGDHSHNLDSSTLRHKERRTNGGACHAGGDCSFGSVGGPLSHHPDFMGPTAWPSAWLLLASCFLRNLQSSLGSEGLRSLSILQTGIRLGERCMS